MEVAEFAVFHRNEQVVVARVPAVGLDKQVIVLISSNTRLATSTIQNRGTAVSSYSDLGELNDCFQLADIEIPPGSQLPV